MSKGIGCLRMLFTGAELRGYAGRNSGVRWVYSVILMANDCESNDSYDSDDSCDEIEEHEKIQNTSCMWACCHRIVLVLSMEHT
uniref:Uncharacterized protein n=1 Tax=Lactuca sativa TaxID=4236 RepID=A0A9R1ULW7_LACSA|nr:hypothetical protein LSAT_V11C800452420 [Lactuca sativa]